MTSASTFRMLPAALGSMVTLVLAIAAEPTEPLRIICFGAHPDDCEIKASGVAALWTARGHKVKFVSVSNGDIGHWREAGGPLAQRRALEAAAAAKVLGITTEILDNHDGEITPTLENRRTIVRLIREWKADLVLTPRPNDYHPDHRYTAMLVQDAAYMVTVPFFCPDIPALAKNPVFAYYPDGFQKPYPFTPDLAVCIDEVFEKKLAAILCMESQFYEAGANGGPWAVPTEPAKQSERRQQVRGSFVKRDQAQAERFRKTLAEFYGAERAAKVQYAEAFEICEYGQRPTPEELRRLFPFYD